MNRKAVLVVTASILLAGSLPADAEQPYAGQERRQIKALSPEQISDLRAGRGMGLALVAELNGYPGPVHVLELAKHLSLTPEQHARVQALYQAMKSEAAPLGERVITQEAALDRQFADRTVTPESLAAAIAEIGNTQAALRLTHLKYHLTTAEILETAQIARYLELRGYEKPGGAGQHQQGKHHRQ